MVESQHQNGIISKGCIEFGWMQVNLCMCIIKQQQPKTQYSCLLPDGNTKGFDFVDLLVFHRKILSLLHNFGHNWKAQKRLQICLSLMERFITTSQFCAQLKIPETLVAKLRTRILVQLIVQCNLPASVVPRKSSSTSQFTSTKEESCALIN